jgi:hypothetical protein
MGNCNQLLPGSARTLRPNPKALGSGRTVHSSLFGTLIHGHRSGRRLREHLPYARALFILSVGEFERLLEVSLNCNRTQSLGPTPLPLVYTQVIASDIYPSVSAIMRDDSLCQDVLTAEEEVLYAQVRW